MSPKWQIRSPKPPIPEKQQQFGSYPQINQLCKSLGTHSRNVSRTVEPKNLEITTPKEKQNSFISVCTSHPQDGTAQTQEGTPQIERDPLARKGSLGGATSFPSLWGHLKKDPFQFHPLHRPAKLRCIGKAKNMKKNKGCQRQLHSRSNLVPSDLLCRGPRETLPLRKAMASTAVLGLLQISLVFAPQYSCSWKPAT